MDYSEAMDLLSRVLEAVGAAIIVAGMVLAAATGARAYRAASLQQRSGGPLNLAAGDAARGSSGADGGPTSGSSGPAGGTGPGTAAFVVARRTLGRGILLGLEVLVGADIIRTVAVSPTFDSVIVLGLVVLIRTFLSFSLSVEIDGAPPWRRAKGAAAAASRE